MICFKKTLRSKHQLSAARCSHFIVLRVVLLHLSPHCSTSNGFQSTPNTAMHRGAMPAGGRGMQREGRGGPHSPLSQALASKTERTAERSSGEWSAGLFRLTQRGHLLVLSRRQPLVRIDVVLGCESQTAALLSERMIVGRPPKRNKRQRQREAKRSKAAAQ